MTNYNGRLDEIHTNLVVSVFQAMQEGSDDTEARDRAYIEAKQALHQWAERKYGERDAAVTRFEVIDRRDRSLTFGRAFMSHGVNVELSYQDGGRTLKVFVDTPTPNTMSSTDSDDEKFEKWLDEQLTGKWATGNLETELRMAVSTIREMSHKTPKDYAVQPLIRFLSKRDQALKDQLYQQLKSKSRYKQNERVVALVDINAIFGKDTSKGGEDA